MRATLPPLFSLVMSVAILGLLLRLRNLPLDHPNARSLHDRPKPRIGGLGLVPATLAAWWVIPGGAPLSELSLLATALALVSFLDDCRGLPASVRFACQLGAAAGLVMVIPGIDIGWVAVAAIVGVTWASNLYNFMDGADGLAGGMAITGFGAYALASALAGDWNLASAAACVAAASAGFLIFNFPPSRMFLGDVGSVTLGFLAAAIGLLGWTRQLWPWWMPLLSFSPFLVDASVTLGRRLLRGERVWEAHREHYYQRLVRMGWSHRRLAWFEYLLMLAAALLAISLALAGPATVLVGIGIWSGMLAAIMRSIDRRWATHLSTGART